MHKRNKSTSNNSYERGYQPSSAVFAAVNSTNNTMQSSDRVKTFIFHNFTMKGSGKYPEKEKTLFYITSILAVFMYKT